MAPPHSGDEVVYNVKLLSEMLSKADIGSVEIPAPFLPSATDRTTLPHDSWADIPVLDLSEAESDEAGLAKKMVDAVTDCGFFAFTNHGIPQELIDEIQAQGHKFFNLPLEEKNKIGLLERFYGYTGDYQRYKLTNMPWNEALMMNLQTTQPEEFARKVWSTGDPTFSAAIRNYVTAVQKVQTLILELLAVGLGLEKDFFAKHFSPHKENRQMLRWNYYPTCPKPMDVLGAVAHTDSLVLTILHDGEVGGLQVERNGEWKGVKLVKGALICNSGDFLKVWTNDRFKSPLHRVVVNEVKARMSTLVFANLDDSTVLSAPPSIVEDIGQQRKYKDFRMAEYFEAFSAANAKGKFPVTLELISDAFGIKPDAVAECVKVNDAS